jgi:hypothetical protein
VRTTRKALSGIPDVVPSVPFYRRLKTTKEETLSTHSASLEDLVFPRSYAALWCRDARAVYAGKAVLEKGFLRLTGADRRGCESRESLALSGLDVIRVARGRHERLEGRPVLMLTAPDGPPLRLALLDGGGTLLELAERLTRMKAGASVAG